MMPEAIKYDYDSSSFALFASFISSTSSSPSSTSSGSGISVSSMISSNSDSEPAETVPSFTSGIASAPIIPVSPPLSPTSRTPPSPPLSPSPPSTPSPSIAASFCTATRRSFSLRNCTSRTPCVLRLSTRMFCSEMRMVCPIWDIMTMLSVSATQSAPTTWPLRSLTIMERTPRPPRLVWRKSAPSSACRSHFRRSQGWILPFTTSHETT